MTRIGKFPDGVVHERAVIVARAGQKALETHGDDRLRWGAAVVSDMAPADDRQLSQAMRALARHPEAFKTLLATLNRGPLAQGQNLPATLADGVLSALGACHPPAVLQLLNSAAASLPPTEGHELFATDYAAARALDDARFRAGIEDVPKPVDVAQAQRDGTPL